MKAYVNINLKDSVKIRVVSNLCFSRVFSITILPVVLDRHNERCFFVAGPSALDKVGSPFAVVRDSSHPSIEFRNQ